mgnify:CR=1 FL=1
MVKKMKKTKITHKENGDVLFEPKIDTDTLETGSVYMFHNYYSSCGVRRHR